jgi:soluble lytic murein transglycosylase-like protein
MKTAATVVLIIALIGLIPKKKKHHEQPPPSTRPPVVQSSNCQPPNPLVVDEDAVGRVLRHAQKRRHGAGRDELETIARAIVKYATLNCIEPELAAAIISAESAYNPRAVSPSGACGLGQMLPSTARNNGADNCFDIDQNARASMTYFRRLLDMWAGTQDQVDRALASYLLGPGAVKNHGGVPWNNGTVRQYINLIYQYRDAIKAI